MKISRILAVIGAVVLALILVVPFLIPVQTSGTATYKEVAGEGATFASAQGIDIYYEKTDFACQEGKDCSNPPVIFLMHGFGANTFSFREVTEPLSQLGDVIAYDRPGFGLSERPTSWEGENPYGSIGQDLILDQLITEFASGRDVILVGHSAGGTLAAQYVVDNKDAIQGLILISPAILSTGGSPSWLNWVFSIPQLDHLGPLLVSSIASSGMDLLNESWYNKDLITEEVKAGYREPLSVIGWEEGFWEFNRAPRAFDVKDRLDEITVPTLLITGDADTVVATADTEALANMIKDSVLFVIPQSGHLAQEETPADTMKAIQVVWSILTR
ncbi:MhpC Predicted hydrolases or acyltransferases (alpha/beta hydrolase superfamily) [Microbacteriaceae bacterium]